jgi:putative transcription factor
MCGRSGRLVKARVEGSELEVCEACSKFGKVLIPPNRRPEFQKKRLTPQTKRPTELITLLEDYPQKIREARHRLGLTQEEFAIKAAEKHSLIQKIESGDIKPSVPLARKLEQILKIKIVMAYNETAETTPQAQNKSSHFTIADFIKTKTKM